MANGKSIDHIPDFAVADIQRKFACWMQKRCRDNPKFVHELADVTWASEDTIKRWRKGHPAGFEAMLRALAYGESGPAAVNEVLLSPMGMTGARWLEDEPGLGGMYAAIREIRRTKEHLATHPNSEVAGLTVDAVLTALADLCSLLQGLHDLQRARASAQVVQMPGERDRRA